PRLCVEGIDEAVDRVEGEALELLVDQVFDRKGTWGFTRSSGGAAETSCEEGQPDRQGDRRRAPWPFRKKPPRLPWPNLEPHPSAPLSREDPRPPRRHTSTKLSTRPGEVPFPTFDQKLAALNREATSRARRESRRRPGARGGGSPPFPQAPRRRRWPPRRHPGPAPRRSTSGRRRQQPLRPTRRRRGAPGRRGPAPKRRRSPAARDRAGPLGLR